MKKIFAFILLCTILTFTGCFSRSEPPQKSEISITIEDSQLTEPPLSNEPTSSPENEASAVTVSKMLSEPAENQPGAIDNSKPEYITDIHDFSTGNYIFNPNLLYINNDRYYADFIPEKTQKLLWKTANTKNPSEKYSPKDALSYARTNWNTHIGLCANFLSHCLLAGGITEFTESSTSITLQLLDSGLGFGQFVPVNSDHTVTLPDYAAPGDVVQVYCPYEGMTIHSLLYAHSDEQGCMCVYCHNFANDASSAFRVVDSCYDCYYPITEVFFYHFYNENDKAYADFPEIISQNNKRAVLYEDSGSKDPGVYNRQAAIDYAKENPGDGLWEHGAENLSNAFCSAGINVYYPNSSALFIQLLKSRLGTAETISINPNRTVNLPEYAEAGDAAFLICREEGEIISSFLVAGADNYGRMRAYSYDKINSDSSAFKADSVCPWCGGEITECILYHFD